VAPVRGFLGKPSHPPLTDASIGAYTVGAVKLVLGAPGIEEERIAHWLLAIAAGLALALPMALTGLLDGLESPRGPTKAVAAGQVQRSQLLASVLEGLIERVREHARAHTRVHAGPVVRARLPG